MHFKKGVKILKRCISFLLAVTIVFSSAYVGFSEVNFCPSFAVETKAANESGSSKNNYISIGDTITLGKYLGEPIVWRCVDIDENGPLMLSEKILCLKAFDAKGTDSTYHTDGWGYIRNERGSNCWQDSNLRQWLNSDETQVSWTHCPPKAGAVSYNAYDAEAGFLSNFTASERALMKKVTQKVSVNIWETNRTGYCDGGSSDTGYKYLKNDSYDINNYYYKNISDTIFILTGSQVNRIYKRNPGYLVCAPTEQAVENSDYTNLNSTSNFPYWINVPLGNNYACYELHSTIDSSGNIGGPWVMYGEYGVRPAFYLDAEYYNPEALIMKKSISVLSDQDAINFLSFLYNRKDGFKDVDVRSDIQYKLLTGNLPSDMTVDEIKGLIAAFLSVVETLTNRQISDNQYKVDFFFGVLKERLEKELSGMSNLDESIISEQMGNMSKLVEDGLVDIGAGIVWRTTGIRITEKHLDDIGNVFAGLSKASDIVSRVQSMVNYTFAAVDLYGMVLGQENIGRVSYFNAYINFRGLNDDVFQTTMDLAFDSIVMSYPLSKGLNLLSWINGKDSWINHRDDIDRWGEYIYQLGQYQNQDFHEYDAVEYPHTCTIDGYTEYECVYCGKTFTADIIKAPGHKYVKTTITPTCQEQGYNLNKCKNCGDSYKDNYKDALGHSVYKQEVIASTCSEVGYTLNYCKCGYQWVSDEKSALQHNYITTVVEPTEIKQGYTLNECSNCGDVYYTNYVDPTGHKYTVSAAEATCEQNGVITYTCDCGETYTETISAKGHAYVLNGYDLPTCTKTGLKTYKCKKCDSAYTQMIMMVAHDYTCKVENTEPTCSEKGYISNYCVCGATTVTDYTDALGHSYEITEIVDATCTSEGSVTSECLTCGDVTTEATPALGDGHTYELIESSKRDCVSNQYQLYECSTCGMQKYENVILAEGHAYDTCETVYPTCTEAGTCIYICTTCNEKITEILPATQHTKGEWEYTNSGVENEMVRKCTACGDVVETSTEMHSITWNINGNIIIDYLPTGTVIAPPSTPAPDGYKFSYWYPSTPLLAIGEENISFNAVFFNENESVYAADGFSFVNDVDGNTAIIDSYLGTDTDVNIPNYICGCSVTQLNENCIPSGVINVTVPSTVVSIDEIAFNCDTLESITVDVNNIAYITVDGILYNAEKTSLLKVPEAYTEATFTILDTVTTIGEYACQGCSNLTSITIPDNVTEIGAYAFRYCSDLAEINLPDSAVAIGKYAFAETGITELTLPENVASIGSCAFSGCENLEKINYNVINCTMDTTNILLAMLNHPFRNSSNITEVTIGESVEVIPSQMFYGRSSITSVYITNLEHWCSIDFQGVNANPLSFAENFYLNDELVTDLAIPETVETINNYAFYKGSCFDSVTISDSVTSIGTSAFAYCDGLTSVTIPGSVASIGPQAFRYCDYLSTVILEDGVTSIGANAFADCPVLARIRIPESVETIETTVFTNNTNTAIYCDNNSMAHTFAINNSIPFIANDDNTIVDLKNSVIYTNYQNKEIFDIMASSKGFTYSINSNFSGTGALVDVMRNGVLNSQYTLVVNGDTNGDSVCDVLDCADVERASSGNIELSDAYKMAADSNSDDVIDIIDYQSVVNKALA